MKLFRKTFDVVLGLCLDGVQVGEASDQDVLDAYAQISKDVRELDATMRKAKAEGKVVVDEIFREDVVDTWKLHGFYRIDHAPPVMPGTLKDTAASVSFGVDHAKGADSTAIYSTWRGHADDADAVKRAVEKLGEGGGHKVEGPVLVPPGYDVATLRGRVEQLEARETAWKEKLAALEERATAFDVAKISCHMIRLDDKDFVVALEKLASDARRADRCEQELDRRERRISELSMQLAALRKELSEANGETRAKLAERRAMWRARCEEAERKYGVLVDSLRAIVGGTEEFGKSIRKMKADLETAEARLAAETARAEKAEKERDNAEDRWRAEVRLANRWSKRAHEAEALLDQALRLGREMVSEYASGHAAGYAEAVADVREWIRKTFSGDVVRLLGADLDAGAHVGAAKKGGG